MSEYTPDEMMRARLILLQWATYIQKGYKSWPTGEIESLSPLSRQEAALTVSKLLECQPFSEAGLQAHLQAWYRNTKGHATTSATEPEKFRTLRILLEEIAAGEVRRVLSGH